MRIVCAAGAGGTAAAERRLAAWMLCLEHGALAYGPDLEPLPEPWAPWPVLRLGPRTAGLGAEIHYRPAVGVVFYFGPGRGAGPLARRLAALLERLPADHLDSGAVAASPVTVTRCRGRAGPAVVAPVSARPAGGEGAWPGRALRYAQRASAADLAFVSAGAAFTWLVLPAAVALGLRAIRGMAEANALVASVLYDPLGCTRLADGAEVFRLELRDLAYPPLPAALQPLAARNCSLAEEAVLLVCPPGFGAAQAALGLRGGPTGRLLLTGPAGPEACAEGARGARALAGPALDPVPWAWGRAGATACCVCLAPAGGDLVALLGLAAAEPGRPVPGAPAWPVKHRPGVWAWASLGPKVLDALVCEACWAAAGGLGPGGALRAQLASTRAPFSQAEACAAGPLAAYAPLLAGEARPLPGVPSAYLVRLAPGAAGDQKEAEPGYVIVAAGSLGPVPDPGLGGGAFARYPAVFVPRLAEAPGWWPPPPASWPSEGGAQGGKKP